MPRSMVSQIETGQAPIPAGRVADLAKDLGADAREFGTLALFSHNPIVARLVFPAVGAMFDAMPEIETGP